MDTNPDDTFLNVLTDILRQSTSPDAQQARDLILKRIALEGDVTPSRLPAPLNITELGGYLNLLEKLGEGQLRQRMLSAVLGVAVSDTLTQGPTPGSQPGTDGPVLYFSERTNDRPPGVQQAAIPISFSMRSDFMRAFDALLATLHGLGCMLPVLSPIRYLPSVGTAISTANDMLTLLGRTLIFVPSAALVDPATDALIVGNIHGEQKTQLAARLAVPDPENTPPGLPAWDAWKWENNSSAMIQVTVSPFFRPLEADLNAAGWYNAGIQPPQSLLSMGGWNLWTNTTGLVAGLTRLGDEVHLLYTQSAIAASSVRELLDRIWNGETFA